MKFTLYYILIAVFLISCSQDQSSESSSDTMPNKSIETEEVLTPADNTPPPAANQPPQNNQNNATVDVPAGSDGVVYHYVCSNNCATGKANQPGKCPECGSDLAHNTAFHNQNTNTTPQTNSNQPNITTPQNNQTTPPPTPAQNAAGVWHYTCPNGCAGGGAGATPCPQCGTTLVHNGAYHQ